MHHPLARTFAMLAAASAGLGALLRVIAFVSSFAAASSTPAAAAFPSCPDATDTTVRVGQKLSLVVRPTCWTGWITMAPGWSWLANPTTWCEYLFPDGGRRMDRPGVMLPKMPADTFRIRGEGLVLLGPQE